ncbi:MAG: NFACT family protein [Desulfuromonadales bacterium]
MDAFLLDAVAGELDPLLFGSRINKIYQPAADHLILRLWTGRKNYRLSLNLAPDDNTLHLTDRTYPNPYTPPRFCQLLRSRLKILKGIDRLRGERILRFIFTGPDHSPYVLVAELFGKNANLILLDDEGAVVDVLKRTSSESRRPMRPGNSYTPPPRDAERISLFDETAVFSGLLQGDDNLALRLKKTITPMTDLIALDLQAQAEQGGHPVELLKSLQRRCLVGDYTPGIAVFEGRNILSAFCPQALSLEKWQPFASANDALEYDTSESAQLETGFIDRRHLRQALEKGRKKLTKRLKKIEQDGQAAETFEQQKIRGELLLANLHRIKKGMKDVILENYYENPPVPETIPLDPLLTPQENAQRYFWRYKKRRRGLAHLHRRIDETRQEQQWLEQMALHLEEASTPDDLREIAEDLTEAGLMVPRNRPADPRRPPSLRERLRNSTSPSGFPLYWGRNPRTNDYVSRHLAADSDLWFHAHNMPGCHLVLKKEGRSVVPDEDIVHAAALAAGYSRGRTDSHVEVMVTEAGNVKKPKGARPGLVTVERYRTIRVSPIRLEGDET